MRGEYDYCRSLRLDPHSALAMKHAAPISDSPTATRRGPPRPALGWLAVRAGQYTATAGVTKFGVVGGWWPRTQTRVRAPRSMLLSPDPIFNPFRDRHPHPIMVAGGMGVWSRGALNSVELKPQLYSCKGTRCMSSMRTFALHTVWMKKMGRPGPE